MDQSTLFSLAQVNLKDSGNGKSSHWAKLQALYKYIPSCLVCPQRKNIYSKNMNKFGKVYLCLSVSESVIGKTLLVIILDILPFILKNVGSFCSACNSGPA